MGKILVKRDYQLDKLINLAQGVKLPELTRVVFFGNSVTEAPEGFVNVIKNIFFEFPHLNKIKIINAGLSGDTTTGAIRRVIKDVVIHLPELVFLMFGLNDSAPMIPGGIESVPLNSYSRNLKALLRIIQEETSAKLILMTPNGVIGEASERKGWEKKLAKYAQRVREIAQSERIPLVDIWRSFEKFKDKALLLTEDGFHPNILGHRVIVREILKILRKEA